MYIYSGRNRRAIRREFYLLLFHTSLIIQFLHTSTFSLARYLYFRNFIVLTLSYVHYTILTYFDNMSNIYKWGLF